MAGRINQQIQWLDVPMNVAFPMNIEESPDQLITIQLHKQRVHRLVEQLELVDDPRDRHGNVVHHNVKYALIGLLSLSEEGMLHLYNVRVFHVFEHRQLSILVLLYLFSLLYLLHQLLDGNELASITLY